MPRAPLFFARALAVARYNSIKVIYNDRQPSFENPIQNSPGLLWMLALPKQRLLAALSLDAYFATQRFRAISWNPIFSSRDWIFPDFEKLEPSLLSQRHPLIDLKKNKHITTKFCD